MDNVSLLKISDVAEVLQISTRQVLNLCKPTAHTPLPHVRVNGRSIRFRPSDLDKWFTKHTIASI
jgi:excisionase family DNA binding protein